MWQNISKQLWSIDSFSVTAISFCICFGNFSIPLYMLFYIYFHICKGILTCNPDFFVKVETEEEKSENLEKNQSGQFEKSRFRDSNSPSSGLTNSCSNLVSRSTYRCTKWGTLSTDDFCRILILSICIYCDDEAMFINVIVRNSDKSSLFNGDHFLP